ncbi:4-oxalomesaconate tautomerase [Pseudomonas akapageensis]|uniref:4-oxalomesaconate tautomerase n=1 Tax=Pseudomonas akapageensis TaxID=2609961 RepID=UPI00140CE2D6|nr:4-oxalomesaconate tautomerase [Pseudomonas akapageensis]
MQKAIPYMHFRGGSSKGLYFNAADLPSDPDVRNRILIAAMAGLGGNDGRQIDGLGGGDPLSSKVAIVSRSQRVDADLDYTFVQVVVGGDSVDTIQNCGNILAGVVPYAIEAGLVTAQTDQTRARVHMLNSETVCEVVVQTPHGQVRYDGDAKIDGVPGTAAPITCNFIDVAGSTCGALLPTGRPLDVINDVEATLIDNGMPVVILRATDFGISGYESCDKLNANATLKQQLELIRLQAGKLMGLGDVTDKVVPKMCLVAAPRQGGQICTRTFIPHVCHSAIGVLGAVSVATATILPGTVTTGLAELPFEGSNTISVEHPSGEFSVSLEVDRSVAFPEIKSAGLLRTARLLSKGEVFIPESVMRDPL